MDNANFKKRVGVLGATSLVGASLLPLLTQSGWRATAYSRRVVDPGGDEVTWQRLPDSNISSSLPTLPGEKGDLSLWISLAPIWVLPEHFALLESNRVQRVVALSSTSRFTKKNSLDPDEQAVARRLTEAEARVQAWAENRGVEWVILRPTLIYGLGRDKNITEIARFINRFGFFPLFGRADGLRQPIHAQDVAGACMASLQEPNAANRSYNISGGETLTYRDMVGRIFTALGRPLRMVSFPLWIFRVSVTLLRFLPRYRNWSSSMVERMNRDLVFDHAEAFRDFAFKPRKFSLLTEDVMI